MDSPTRFDCVVPYVNGISGADLLLWQLKIRVQIGDGEGISIDPFTNQLLMYWRKLIHNPKAYLRKKVKKQRMGKVWRRKRSKPLKGGRNFERRKQNDRGLRKWKRVNFLASIEL